MQCALTPWPDCKYAYEVVLKAVITLEDDIDGCEAVETITLALDGDDYEIDWSAANAGHGETRQSPVLFCCDFSASS
ncbi:histone-like nucleoid-structuring protein Lsr2 [Pseudarthrobacter equi]|uniref:Lsr2 dimerization domain-containing protein n=1 Tax=Pseudarthrobacter equi TaxID=728066 RepID=UPI0036F2A66C